MTNTTLKYELIPDAASGPGINLDTVVLASGSHDSPDEGHCLLEVVSMFAGESFGDHPVCVCPVLAAFGRSWNDGMRSDDERAQLRQYIPSLIGTRSTKQIENRRAMMAMDWMIRTYAAAWLDRNPGLRLHAAALRAHPEIVDTAGLISVLPIAVAAQTDADAAWASAGAAARDAAWASARDALSPTVTELQASAHALFDRMIRVGDES